MTENRMAVPRSTLWLLASLLSLALASSSCEDTVKPAAELPDGSDTVELPEDTSELPEDTSELPEDTVELPEDTVELPEDTVELPEDAVEADTTEGLDNADDELSGGDSERLAALLADTVEGLWFMSESDYPYEVVLIEQAALPAPSVDNIKQKLASIYVARAESMPLAERSVEVSSVDEFFLPRLEPQDWWGDAERADAARLETLRQLFVNELSGSLVFRVGPFSEWSGLAGDIDIFILGASADGDLVGVWTVSIET